jgi:NAD(P)-dependent dehydrogenase (short-subunit alcohol dehydrogenase family)
VKSWESKAAVVTGGASGIGLEIARGLVGRGVRVVIADIEEAALETAAEELRALGGEVLCSRTDVSDFAQMQALSDLCQEKFGDIHLLFNNAGVLIMGPTWELSTDDWRWLLSVNVNGVVHGIKAFLPRMLAHNQESYVVNTGSLASFSGHGDYAPYSASKAAVLSISQSLYSEMRAMMTNIGVSVVCPGVVQTRIHESWRNRPAEDATWSRRDVEDPERVASSLAYRSRGKTPREIAESIFEGMLADKFYIFTDASANTFVRAALEPAIVGQNPIVSTWGLDKRPLEERKWSW